MSEATAAESAPTGPPARDVDGDDGSLIQPALGEGLRRLRRGRGLSLADASRATGLSSSFLSIVEKGNSDIAIGRLMRLMRVYGASIGDLDPGSTRAGDDPVVRGGQGKHIRSQEGIDLYLLAPDTNRKMMPVTTTYAPRTETDEPPFTRRADVPLRPRGHAAARARRPLTGRPQPG